MREKFAFLHRFGNGLADGGINIVDAMFNDGPGQFQIVVGQALRGKFPPGRAGGLHPGRGRHGCEQGGDPLAWA